MELTDIKWWREFRAKNSNTISGSEVKKISELHAKYFNHKYQKLCTCNPKQAQSYINDLNELYNSI